METLYGAGSGRCGVPQITVRSSINFFTRKSVRLRFTCCSLFRTI
jgi:hypothetical protein